MNHDAIKEQILGTIATLGFSPSEVSVSFDDEHETLWFSISSQSARLLLSRGAEALSALNHIASKIVEKHSEDGSRLRAIVDANEYERKKMQNLRTVAHMMAERARYFKSSIDVDPMPARDRRIVHEFLSTMPDIKTESVGEGNGRHIVIKYIGTI